ncbi:amylo-alpha-1,6-glucosidase [Iningainema tapete]|uniref:Glycogen debranching enzyme family protein n=1 Tax=Iningainema tapete BLCC-T55 TaxID=2748662 RepID=A0A8J6XHN8_9CYAN|nr:amylo-alpha-1,6-glucosidase [Iningainema tapete]MBD2770841.1 glycogen debranching enzyme family protein [Iningainema tapete BLCC-T55]
MVDLDTREWVLTNGLGSFASGTVCDVRTRTYHGWLFGATNSSSGRTLLFSHLEASLELPAQILALGTNIWGGGQIEPTGYQLLRCFDIHKGTKWIWGDQEWQLSRQMIMPYTGIGQGARGKGQQSNHSNAQFCHSLLIQYRYEGFDAAILRLRLLIGDRDLHHPQKATGQLHFSQMLGQQQVCLQAINSGNFGTPWHLRWSKGKYQIDPVWYWNYSLPEETNRGLSDEEDLYSPGYLTINLKPGDAVTLEARVGFPERLSILTEEAFAEVMETEHVRLCDIFAQASLLRKQFQDKQAGELAKTGEQKFSISPTHKLTNSPTHKLPYSSICQKLLKAADQFIITSSTEPRIIAGYHWFNDIGRDTLIALPGLALVPQRFDLAKGLLRTLGASCRYGLIPNAEPAIGEPFYNNMDASLWWIETLGLYLEATQDWQFLIEQYPIVQQIYKALIGGTRYNIQVDSIDGLVSGFARGLALTWMDAVVEGQPVTPRRGKPVEINALWYSALCWASRWAEILSEYQAVADSARLIKQAQRYTQHAQQVKASLQKFWNSDLGYLYDTIDPDDYRNTQIRPNAVLALSFSHCGFSQHQGRQILTKAVTSLLTPYGLRSLAPSDREYVGKYVGDSIQRDRAYHQGTVWCWLIGPFVRAWQRFYADEPLPFDWQRLLNHFLAEACLDSISQIFDGDEPHTPRGAIAQACSVAEVLRHFVD